MDKDMERDLGKEMEQDLENEAVLDQIRKDAESVELPERLSPEHMKEMILAEEAAAGSAEAPQTEEIPERRKPMWRKALIGITAAAASLAVIVGSASVISRQGKGTGSLASGNDPASWVASVEDKNEDGAAQLAGEMIETEADETVETAMAELADSPAVTEGAPAAEAEPDTSWSLAATLKLPAGLDISATYKGIYQKLAASGALDFLRADRRAAVSRGYYFTNGMSIDAVAEEEDAMEAPAAAENFNTASNADTVAKGDTGMAVTASGMGGDEEAVEDDAAGDSSEWSTTNTRTENVDESDIVKTDGRFIYRLTSSDEGGKVVKIVHAEQGKVWAASEVRLEQDQENEWSNYDDMFLQDGKLILMESPTITHQRIIAEIHWQISSQIREKKGPCEIFLSPLDVRMVKEENTILEPDLFIVCDSEKTTGKRIEGTPDFVLEVLSPGTRRKDMVTKLGKYMDAGVREYWMIDPDKRVLLRYLAAEDWIPEIHPLEGILGLGIYEGSITVDLNAIGKICS